MNSGTSPRARILLRFSHDDAFSLIEVVVALMLTVTVMTVTAGFFVRSLASTRLMQQRQSAVAVAQQAMERTRAVPVANLTNSTVTGSTDPAYRVGNINYTVETTVAPCGMPPGMPLAGTAFACGADTSSPNILMYRVTVNVSWTPGGHVRCAGLTACTYTVTALRDEAATSTKDLREVPT